MAISRRKFVKAGALVFLSAGIPSVVANAASNPLASSGKSNSGAGLPTVPPHKVGPVGPMGQFTQELFTPHLNSMFRIHAESRAVNVRLVNISDHKADSSAQIELAGKECFSLMFLGQRGVELQQNTYQMAHSSLGTFELLLVPVGINSGTQQYQAVFTRL
ncbi:MAG TPA: hypothetical protein VF658_14725 [Pyrinomonadaceae bacterium]|jgi:hypothetical protein